MNHFCACFHPNNKEADTTHLSHYEQTMESMREIRLIDTILLFWYIKQVRQPFTIHHNASPMNHRTLSPSSHSHPTLHYLFRFPIPLKIIPPTTPAAIATPLSIATPINPSFATLSSIRPLKLLACRFAGSFSSNKSLYLRASA